MATLYSNPSTLKVVLASLLLLLTIKVNSVEGVSFNFTKFTDDGSLILQGDAKIWTDGILALPSDPLIGKTTSRVLYATPVPIWDSNTGSVASFVSSFSFVVSDVPGYKISDGLVFFLAPWGTTIPPNSEGKNLGILDEKNGYNQFVAVEFDSYNNTRDPTYRHIGIDVNSVMSLNLEKWNRVSGALEKAIIIYDSPTKTLSVVVTHQNGKITTVAQQIDLKVVLPKEVSVGFSATTWNTHRERHDIHSWSFTSTFETNYATDENIHINHSSA